MDCPRCGGECFDNRQKKASGAYKPGAPDFACKDKEGCGWKKFPPKGAKPQGGNGAIPRVANGPLGALYFGCMKIAAATCKQYLGEKATPADVVAATATLFIAASEGRGPLRAPPKPKPEPEPEQEEEYEESADGLPF